VVAPQSTAQMCSGCGERVEKRLSVRTHTGPFCGLISVDSSLWTHRRPRSQCGAEHRTGRAVPSWSGGSGGPPAVLKRASVGL